MFSISNYKSKFDLPFTLIYVNLYKTMIYGFLDTFHNFHSRRWGSSSPPLSPHSPGLERKFFVAHLGEGGGPKSPHPKILLTNFLAILSNSNHLKIQCIQCIVFFALYFMLCTP